MFKVGIIIPCYRASGLINNVVENILSIEACMRDDFNLKIYIIDDSCPEKSWLEVKKNKMMKKLFKI